MLQKTESGQTQAEAECCGEYQDRAVVDPKFVAELEQLNALFNDSSLDTKQQWNGLLDIAYTRLYRIATRLVGSPDGTPTLGATALVNEGYSRLMQSSDLAGILDAHHFYRRFAMCMKHALIDHARSKLAEKRGGQYSRLDFDAFLSTFALPPDQLLQLNESLDELKHEDIRSSDLIHMRYFGQMSILEISQLTGLSTATIERSLRFGRAYLRSKLDE